MCFSICDIHSSIVPGFPVVGIMTAKLLPPFLECFHSNYVSVRMEACIACSHLAIKDESVIDSLIYLTTYDGVWKVKALALQGYMPCLFIICNCDGAKILQNM